MRRDFHPELISTLFIPEKGVGVLIIPSFKEIFSRKVHIFYPDSVYKGFYVPKAYLMHFPYGICVGNDIYSALGWGM
jgi:hypothetical protein